MYTRFKRTLRSITWMIVPINVQDDGAVDVLWRINYLIKEGLLANDIPSHASYGASQSRVSTRWSPFITHVKCIVISIYLNSVLYTRLFTKLHLFKILFYVTFIAIKVSRSNDIDYILIAGVWCANDQLDIRYLCLCNAYAK